jgi:hypothetical protein
MAATTLPPVPTCQPRIASRSSHACLQRRQTSAQRRQCSRWAACRSHSSAQARQAAAQASIVARRSRRSGAVCRVTMRPVASQASAQSRLRRMQRTNSCRSSSLRQASAQAVQLAAQSRHSWIQRRSVSRSRSVGFGCSLKILGKVTGFLSPPSHPGPRCTRAPPPRRTLGRPLPCSADQRSPRFVTSLTSQGIPSPVRSPLTRARESIPFPQRPNRARSSATVSSAVGTTSRRSSGIGSPLSIERP